MKEKKGTILYSVTALEAPWGLFQVAVTTTLPRKPVSDPAQLVYSTAHWSARVHLLLRSGCLVSQGSSTAPPSPTLFCLMYSRKVYSTGCLFFK